MLPFLQVDAFLLTVVSACIRFVIQIIPPKVSQECTSILELKLHNILSGAETSWTSTLSILKNLALLVFLPVSNERSLDHQFLSDFFPHEIKDHQVRIVTDPSF